MLCTIKLKGITIVQFETENPKELEIAKALAKKLSELYETDIEVSCNEYKKE